jgi:xylan 1,4-beta-xylosidase
LKNKTQIADVEFEGYGEQREKATVDYKFDSELFKLDFQTPRAYPDYKVENGVLRLFGGDSPVSDFRQSMLVRRQTDFNFEARTSLTMHGSNFQQMAGLIYRYDERTHYFLRVSYDDAGSLALGLICMDGWEFSMPIAEIPLGEGKIFMKLNVDGRSGVFSYSCDGVEYTEIPHTIDVSTLSDDYAEPLGFTGAYVGMMCVDMRDRTAWADFHSFIYSPKA